MNDLTDDQKAAVRRWVAEGCSLTKIQKRLNTEFQRKLTFMDVRLLVLDLNLKLQDRAMPRAALDLPKQPAPGRGEPPEDEAEYPTGGGGVSVTLDRIVKPGAVVSGSVRLSDGVTAT